MRQGPSPQLPAVPSVAVSQEDAREGGVLPVLVSPPELSRKTTYAYISVRDSGRGAESPSESAQGDRDPAPGSS